MLVLWTFCSTKYSGLSLNRTHTNLRFYNFVQLTAKYRSTVLQTAPTGAGCNTVDLYLATICVKPLKISRKFRPV